MSGALCSSPSWILGRVLCKWDWLGAGHILSTCPKFQFPKDMATGDSDKWEKDACNYVIITYKLIKVFLCVSSFWKIIPGFFTANSFFFLGVRPSVSTEILQQQQLRTAGTAQVGIGRSREEFASLLFHLQPRIRKCCSASWVSGSQANKSGWDVALGYSKWAVVSRECVSMEADFRS